MQPHLVQVKQQAAKGRKGLPLADEKWFLICPECDYREDISANFAKCRICNDYVIAREFHHLVPMVKVRSTDPAVLGLPWCEGCLQASVEENLARLDRASAMLRAGMERLREAEKQRRVAQGLCVKCGKKLGPLDPVQAHRKCP